MNRLLWALLMMNEVPEGEGHSVTYSHFVTMAFVKRRGDYLRPLWW
jgi:hypothetical protein